MLQPRSRAATSPGKPTAAAPPGGRQTGSEVPISHSEYQSIEDVTPEEWDSLCEAGGDPFMDRRFIAVAERSFAARSRFCHVICRDPAGVPLAIACFSTYQIDWASLAEGGMQHLLDVVGWIYPRLLRTRLVLCGLPISAGQSHLRFAPGAPHGPILRVLDGVARRLAACHRARFIVFKEFAPNEHEALAGLASLGYRRADSYPMNVASSGYSHFEDFLARAKSQTRHACRRSQKKFNSGGFEVAQFWGQEAARLFTDDVYSLYLQVESKSPVHFEKLPADFFRDLFRALPDEAVLTAVLREQKIVAFAISLLTRRLFCGMELGFDYSLNAAHDLYFNVLFQAMDVAFRSGAKTLYTGQLADAVKREKLGCHQESRSIFVAAGRPVMEPVLRYGFSLLFPPHPITEGKSSRR